MKKTFALLLILLSTLLLFGGCVSDRTHAGMPPIRSEALTLPLRHSYPNLGFSLDFPEHWTEYLAVQQDGCCVTISIDGKPTYSFASVKNGPGAKEKDVELTEAGYTYYRQNGTHFFYHKILGIIPTELYVGSPGNKDPEQQTDEAMYACWKIDLDNDVCTVLVDESDYYLSMKSGEYVNYRLGISVTIPEFMLRNSSVYLKPADYTDEASVDLVLREELPPNGALYDYLICSIIAVPVSDPFRDFFNLVDSPELLYLEGRLYGVTNEWRDSGWRTNIYVQYGWERYPEYIQKLFTFEDVQQVVDSFKII